MAFIFILASSVAEPPHQGNVVVVLVLPGIIRVLIFRAS